MSKELVISATPHETRVAIVEDGQLCEIYVEREKEFALVGSIYKGRVTRVLPGMQSAFVDIGLDGDAFLYVSDFLEDIEEYDHIVTTVEEKVQKMEQQGGQVFSQPAAGTGTAVEPPEVTSPGGDTPIESPRSVASPPTSASHDQHSYPQRPFGRGRGRGGHWGRHGGRGDRRHGRELPPTKYASPRSYEPPVSSGEPVILPGESLAKYKDRIPAPPPATVPEEQPAAIPATLPTAEPPAHEPVAGAPIGDTDKFTEPSSAPNIGAAPVSTPTDSASEPPASAALEAAEAAHDEAREFPAGDLEEQASVSAPETELTEDEANTLAEQIAEAQEEAVEPHSEDIEPGEEDYLRVEGYAEEDESQESANKAEAPEPEGQSSSAAPMAEENHWTAPVKSPAASEPQNQSARIRNDPRAHFQRPMRRGGRRRGGPHARPPERHRTAPRGQLISDLLKTGQEIIVQIAKEPLGKKGARITSHVALPGRLLVYMPTVDHIGVSRKISSAEERSRLRRLVLEKKASFPGGFIVRTAAEGASEEEIRNDVEFLGKTWGEIRSRSEQRKAPALLHRDLNLVERILRDQLSPDYTAIWINNEDEFTKVVEFVGRFQPQLVNRVKLYTKETPIFEEFGIQQEIDKALRPKVWLKSGGYIVINHTEALVAIDVNTGKFVGRGSTRLEDTIVRTNLEAVKEIVRQIRLRDLGGIIVVDFIDMEERKNRAKVMQALEDALRADRAPSKVLAFNEFGLVAITRKRTKQALERVLCQPCPYCTGSGMVKSVPTICYEIQTEARKMAQEIDSQSLTLRVNPEIAKALKTRESALVDELEKWARKSVIIQADPTLHWEQYDIY